MTNRLIRHQFSFSQPPETVWEFLTDPGLLAQWLMPNDFKPVVGHRFQFRTKPKLRLHFNGYIFCEVLEIIPYQKLVYSWKGGMSQEDPTLDSVVTWALIRSESGGTILTLEHKGFKGLKNYLAYFIMNTGWKKIGKRMNQLITNRYDKTKP